MNTEAKVKKLLNKYLEGETQPQEEQFLSEYFKKTDVKPEWKVYQQMFTYFEESKAEKSQQSFQPETQNSFRRFYKYVAILVVVLAGAWFYNYQFTTQDLGTYDDPEMAFEQTKKVFDLIGHHLNSAQEDMQYLETLEKTKTQYIDKIKP